MLCSPKITTRPCPKGFFNDEEYSGGPKWGLPYYVGWDGAIYPYTKSVGIYRCPSDGIDRTYSVSGDPAQPLNGQTVPTSYRYNTSNQENGPYNALPLSKLSAPAQAILIAESVPGVNDLNYNDLSTNGNRGDQSFYLP